MIYRWRPKSDQLDTLFNNPGIKHLMRYPDRKLLPNWYREIEHEIRYS